MDSPLKPRNVSKRICMTSQQPQHGTLPFCASLSSIARSWEMRREVDEEARADPVLAKSRSTTEAKPLTATSAILDNSWGIRSRYPVACGPSGIVPNCRIAAGVVAFFPLDLVLRILQKLCCGRQNRVRCGPVEQYLRSMTVTPSCTSAYPALPAGYSMLGASPAAYKGFQAAQQSAVAMSFFPEQK